MAARYVWQGQDYLNNPEIATIANFQTIIFTALTLLLTAMLSMMLSHKWIKDWKASFFPGAISGIVLVIVGLFSGIMVEMIRLSPLSGTDFPFYDSFAKDPAGFIINYYMTIGVPLLIVVLAGMAIAGIMGMAYTFFTLRPSGRKENITAIKRTGTMAVTAIILAIIAMLVIPPYISSMAFNMGWIDGSWDDYFHSVSVTRTSDDTISIKYTGSPGLRLNSDMPYIIMINDKNATNADAIKQSGLDISISPPNGLKNVKGAYVDITGNGVKAQNPRVVICDVSPDGSPREVIFDSVV